MPYVRRNYRKKYTGGNRRTGGRAFTRPATKKVPYKYKKSLKVAISKEISRRQENKFAAWESRPLNVCAGIGPSVTTGNNFLQILPPIPQGVSGIARIGNKINPKYCSIAGFVSLDNTNQNGDYDRIAVRIMCLTPKDYPTFPQALQNITDLPNDNWSWRLLDTGVGAEPFSGSVNDWQMPVNRRTVTLHAERKFVLTRPRLLGTGQGTVSRNGMDGVKFFKMKVPLPKTLVYGIGTFDYPSNAGPVFVIGYSLINGALPPVAPNNAFLTCSFTTRLSYEDA